MAHPIRRYTAIIMNIHPIFVHFPIALFSLYAILELIRIRKLTGTETYFNLKAFLSIVGVASTVITIQTGELARSILQVSPETQNLIRVHSSFAKLTELIFLFIAASYAVVFFERYFASTRLFAFVTQNRFAKPIWQLGKSIAYSIQRPLIICVLALCGLVAVTVTGALGGAIVYGPDIDPIVTFVYNLLLR